MMYVIFLLFLSSCTPREIEMVEELTEEALVVEKDLLDPKSESV